MELLENKVRERIISLLADEKKNIRSFFLSLVRENSETFNKQGVDKVGTLISQQLKRLGMEASIYEHKKFGNLIVLQSRYVGHCPKILISGHTDTVFDPSSGGKISLLAGKIYGPGVCDMKGGLVIAVFTLKALKHLGFLHNVDLMLTPDEEQGSDAFRATQQRIYKKYDLAVIMEGAGQKMETCIERKGVGRLVLEVLGRSGHSGHRDGKSFNAIEEICRLVSGFVSLQDENRGTTINIGVISGGSKLNVIPSRAQAEFSFRFSDLQEPDRLENGLKAIVNLKASNGSRVKFKLEVISTPLVPNDASYRLFKAAQEVSRDWLDQGLKLQKRGSASDGNIIIKGGIGVLDGMGILGRGIHSHREEADLKSIDERVLLMTGTILKFTKPELWKK